MININNKRVAMPVKLKKNGDGYYFLKPLRETFHFPDAFSFKECKKLAETLTSELRKTVVDLSCIPRGMSKSKLENVKYLLASYFWKGGNIPGFDIQDTWPRSDEMWDHCLKQGPLLLECLYLVRYLQKHADEKYGKFLLTWLNRDLGEVKPKLNRVGFYLLIPDFHRKPRSVTSDSYKLPNLLPYEEVASVSRQLNTYLQKNRLNFSVPLDCLKQSFQGAAKVSVSSLFKLFYDKTNSLKKKSFDGASKKKALNACKGAHKEFYEFLHLLSYIHNNKTKDDRYEGLLTDLLSSYDGASLVAQHSPEASAKETLPQVQIQAPQPDAVQPILEKRVSLSLPHTQPRYSASAQVGWGTSPIIAGVWPSSYLLQALQTTGMPLMAEMWPNSHMLCTTQTIPFRPPVVRPVQETRVELFESYDDLCQAVFTDRVSISALYQECTQRGPLTSDHAKKLYLRSSAIQHYLQYKRFDDSAYEHACNRWKLQTEAQKEKVIEKFNDKFGAK